MVFWESTDETAPPQSWLEEGQGYLCLLFGTKQGSFLFFFPLLSVQLLSSSFSLSPCRFLTALIRARVADAGRVRKEEDGSLFFCNLPLILIRGPPAREEALPRAAAKAKFNTVYLTPNYTATHIKTSCPPHLFSLSAATQTPCALLY